jgi:uncharacterized protein (DUF1800 family)
MKPYRPKTYTFEDAAHLLRRAGFGGTPEEIEKLRALGPELAVEQLLTWNSQDGTDPNPNDINAAFDGFIKEGVQLAQALARSSATVQLWWVHKMLTTTQPMKEKLTLFWHGHFASGFDKIKSGFMLQQQNELFRRMGAGEFEPFVLEVSQNPAMLRYLDNDQNTKDHPNENFARELMELFTMGVGNYAEKDIQESARALSGWSIRGGPRAAGKSPETARNPEAVFTAKNHDDGVKTLLGQTGNLKLEDVVRIVCSQPATAKFMTLKLWKFFVNEQIPTDVHTELSNVWVKSKGNISTVLREIFNSEEFYAQRNRYALMKSPVEYVVGALRASNAKLMPAHQRGVVNLMTQQYQALLDPPNVKGWDGGREWIDDSSILNRLNFVGAVVSVNLPAPRGQNMKGQQAAQTPKAELRLPSASSANELIELLGRTYLGESPKGSLRKTLELFSGGKLTPDVVKGMAYLVLASPQYHLA